MARARSHDEHLNHEAWAIPYGDLITLLLAFFVVMYAISSLNEGKYRVLSYSLNVAFGGPPKRLEPIQIGMPVGGAMSGRTPPIVLKGAQGPISPIAAARTANLPRLSRQLQRQLPQPIQAADRDQLMQARDQLRAIGQQIERQLGGLIERDLIAIHKTDLWIEVAIKSDILFASGSAIPSAQAVRVLQPLADTLAQVPNAIRVEGHTDDRPINTLQFPSNWELSAARASSIVRLFATRGINESRLSVLGYGATRPIGSNETAEGRRANRRVVVTILADLVAPDPLADPAEGAPPNLLVPTRNSEN